MSSCVKECSDTPGTAPGVVVVGGVAICCLKVSSVKNHMFGFCYKSARVPRRHFNPRNNRLLGWPTQAQPYLTGSDRSAGWGGKKGQNIFQI